MSIEDHFKSVDWDRIRRMEKAKEEMVKMGIMFSLVLFGILSVPKLTPLVLVVIVICLADLIHSGYDYFKWSRRDMMFTSEMKETEEAN